MQIKLNNIRFRHGKPKKREKIDPSSLILKGLDLTIESGSKVAIAGLSGSGKSTFLQLIKGFTQPTEGIVELDGINPHLDKRLELFDQIGYVFQYPEHQLFAPTVAEDVGFGLRHAKLTALEKETKIRQALEAVGMQDSVFSQRSPLELSGGEKRRVAIAGVLVLEPKVLLLDEPTAGLDMSSRIALFELLKNLNEEQGTTVIWVSHQLEEILEHAPRMLALHQGVFVADGAPEEQLASESLRSLFGWEEPPALTLRRWLYENHGIDISRPWLVEEMAKACQSILVRNVPCPQAVI
ncbi:energy-coupling factor transporter ATP-binding protein EcfA2 [Paenibacillus baekrokdamisoli]|uniref:Energy-coupling factor transporter ATP-binding protein EcfA2 n=1 Tax=Paenibacillus baekrokdamisoli TaxID=1712516 RepID=A0A3G9IV61_9BACL|nr:ATP-binding cassette domain-containing protein [Paenibacillus baekrokdamisoli]MBB3072612.1 energy-coupling factor transport system ATP-binding protein [Paenibacillus baekrokdamisoli]BBH22336.1 energy-coupling factor transporter ATP-binding protein EcfA2 [Paenibacillus baekrokdamisoli]